MRDSDDSLPANLPGQFNFRTQTESQARAGFQGASTARFSSINIRHRGRLPHWERNGGLYFVTFRVHDSLPRECIEQARKQLQLTDNGARLHQRHLERLLDRGLGSRPFNDPRCANVVVEALHALRDKYRLLAWCVMPNHVHLVARLLPDVTLSQVMHSLKSFSAKKVNKVLKKSGALWQREYYDRLIRNADELNRAVSYVVRNPEKAGLTGWKWVANLSGIPER